jgi:acyl-CoA thioester hydrolase
MGDFRKKLQLRWSDMDPNFHMRHSVYYDFGATLRMEFLMKHGVTPKLMMQEHFGPILFREEALFKKELHLGDPLEMDVKLSSLSEDHSRFGMQHHIYRGEEVCAIINVEGAFMDTIKRKLTTPPQIVIDMVDNMLKTESFKWT